MKSFRIILVLFLVFISYFAKSQNTFTPLPCLNKEFSIVVHIVKDSFGLANITEGSIQSMMTDVESYFDSICVSFNICEFRYIDNFQYDSLNKDEPETGQMQSEHNQDYRINMYFVKQTTDDVSFASLGGIASVSSGGLVINKSHGVGVIVHEMGHYFGLSHTFNNSQSANPELVDGSNCTTAGDFVCDTPADPFFEDSGITWVDSTNTYIFMGRDANGDYYTPNVENIMSYYPGACNFTYGQYLRMANTYLNSSPKMW